MEHSDQSKGKLGELLTIENGLSGTQLDKALQSQREYKKAAVPARLGEVLVQTGACPPTIVSEALHRQRDNQLKSNTLGQLLLELGYVTTPQLEQVMQTHMDILAPLGEILLEQGICSQDQIQQALHLQFLRRVTAVRLPLSSIFDPVNIMDLLVAETGNELIRRADCCDCDRCRSNILAISLNGLAPRYVSDMEMLIKQLDLYREEYRPMVTDKVSKAVEQVKANPKLSCRSKTSAVAGSVVGTVTARISNRHIHLTEEHIERLFGPGYRLTKWKDLVQPGQFAAKETVTLVGAKGNIERVRVLGPARPQSQVEISGTDQYGLGIAAPVRESGDLENTPGIRILGPQGSVELERGVIRAFRHIHMTPEDGRRLKVKNRQLVNVRLKGDRDTVLEKVILRITDASALEMHIDTDEANAAGAKAESDGEVLAPG